MYKVYLIKNKQGDVIYIGHTINPHKRLTNHRLRFGKTVTMDIVFSTNNNKLVMKKEKELIKSHFGNGHNLKNKHGGSRPGSGRKKVKDKKIQLSIYPLKSQVKAAGGEKKAKTVALQAIEACA